MRTHGFRTTTGLVALAAVLVLDGSAWGQPLRRDLRDYVVLAMRKATLKDLTVTGACNVGVNCASTVPGSDCGTLRVENASFAPGSQVAADQAFFNKPGAVVWQLFRNGGGPLTNVTILGGPVQTFTTPIIPGTCSSTCEPDFDAIEALCGFPDPFPSCDPSRNISTDNDDCSAFDTNPGNARCDLAPGVYGTLQVRNGSTVQMAAGHYVFCNVDISRDTRVFGTGVTIDVPAGGVFRVLNGSQLGQQCGDFEVHVDGANSTVTFGRNALIAARVCAPQVTTSLGHNNVFIGQFVGDLVSADSSNEFQCCGGRCTCIDDFTPKTASVGQQVTLSSRCDLEPATGVRVCGIDAPIVSKSAAEIVITVPAGASGPCLIDVLSPAGDFTHMTPLVVS